MNDTLEAHSRALVRLLQERAPTAGVHRPGWPRLRLLRAEVPMPPSSVLYNACLCLVAQGSKRAIVGDEVYTYDPLHYLVVPVSLPVQAEIPTASRQHPFLGLSLEFDAGTVNELLLELEGLAPAPAGRGVYLSEVGGSLLSALVRLIQALDDPLEKRMLAPAIEREVLYHVLTGPQGGKLSQFALQDSASHRIARAVRYLQDHFEAPVDIPTLAGEVNMSSSAFHHTFKRVTSLSPIQYLKRFRLHQARALMVQQGLGAADAAFSVGYGSPSQFSREFRRQFGNPPSLEVERLRALPAAVGLDEKEADE